MEKFSHIFAIIIVCSSLLILHVSKANETNESQVYYVTENNIECVTENLSRKIWGELRLYSKQVPYSFEPIKENGVCKSESEIENLLYVDGKKLN
jgi:hypothetical protein